MPKANIKGALTLAFGVVLSACAPGAKEQVSDLQSPVVSNGDFETGVAGAAPPAPWVVNAFRNSGITVQSPQTRAGLNLGNGGNLITTEINGTNQTDPDLGAGASLRWPRYGAQNARINFHSNNAGGNNNPRNVNSLSQTMTIGAGDTDPSDNKLHIRFVFAPVLQNPAHPGDQQPYYFIQVTNVTKGTLIYTDFNLSAQAGIPWKTVNGGTANEIDYLDWTLVDLTPTASQVATGDQVLLEFVAAGCSLGAHFGELYVDGVGSTIPGLFVSGTAPAQVNAGADLAYSLRYHNGAAAAETGVALSFTTPPNTTFQALTPPAGATCTTPAVGSAGTITCTFAAAVAAGATGTLSVTVKVNAGTTGQIVCGNYQIQSTQETPLVGSKITTKVGCALDSDCLGGNWCQESASTCSAKLANGTTVATDPPHVNPTLNGACTNAAATLVCASAVCDTADKKCGYPNGSGSCTAANGATVCRSAACDTADGKCGYADGDGPCTAGSGPTVCRSTVCSANGLCQPQGGCNVDADCTGGKWCRESTHACTDKLPNGNVLPTDAPHTAPTLDGNCTAAAGTLVCTSAVCDAADDKCGHANANGPCTAANGATVCRSAVCDTADGKCGYADGDGPCTTLNAATVCRSSACSKNGLCQPQGGCNVDTDCTSGNWCAEASHTCTAKLDNGSAIPSDAPHMSPTLDGTCSASASTLVCTSAVCDPADDKCGFADGDGPCTAANGATVCRSGACSSKELCQPPGGCNADADCAAGQWCNESMHACLDTLPNGSAIPSDAPHASPTLDGACSEAAGALVCSSAVCDSNDNACGFADGDGPCTAADGATVCRSTLCAANGANQGTCVACLRDSDCAGAAGMCNLATNTCAGCNTSADCMGAQPVCDAAAGCTACNGDNGSSATEPCPTSSAPLCFLSGATAGGCGKCTLDADCEGHAGNLCDAASGQCTTGCRADGDCLPSEWCNAEQDAVGTCVTKLSNGTPLPAAPSSVTTCSPAVGQRVCVTGACDGKDNACGLATGDGSCQNDEQCRQGTCDPTGQTCSMGTNVPSSCSHDADCAVGEFCGAAGCTPKLPVGAACGGENQCQSNDCRDSVCSSVIGQGSGLLCATRPVGSQHGGGTSGLCGVLLAAAGLARRRRRLGLCARREANLVRAA